MNYAEVFGIEAVTGARNASELPWQHLLDQLDEISDPFVQMAFIMHILMPEKPWKT